MKRQAAAALSIALFTAPAFAGVYADDLAKCLVASTTPDDRVALVKWMFTAVSANPAIATLSKATKQDIDAANKIVGALFTRLITVDCREKARLAVSYEGAPAIQVGFQVLGQVAGRELFSSPEVTQAMSGLQSAVDDKKIAEVFKDAAPADSAATPAAAPAPAAPAATASKSTPAK